MPSVERDPNRVIVFDTTLRDGEQAPGFSMNAEKKVEMATALRDLGVDVIEAGFAAASPGDAEAVRRVAGEVEGPIFCSLSRASEDDIRTAYGALQSTPKRRLHIFLSTSPIHRAAKLNHEHATEVLETAVRAVSVRADVVRRRGVLGRGRDPYGTAPFLPRSWRPSPTLARNTLNIPDTVGYSTPEEIGSRSSPKSNVAGHPRAPSGRCDLCTLPQRPRHGRRQHAFGSRQWRAAS